MKIMAHMLEKGFKFIKKNTSSWWTFREFPMFEWPHKVVCSAFKAVKHSSQICEISFLVRKKDSGKQQYNRLTHRFA
jgi:hypothetical protein